MHKNKMSLIILLITICTLMALPAIAQDMDITMDVIEESGAEDINESIMNRIDMPHADRGMQMSEDAEHHHDQSGTHMDNDSQGTDHAQMNGDMHDTQDESMNMRGNMHDNQDDGMDMRGDMHDAQDDGMDIRGDMHDAQDDSMDMRGDMHDAQDDRMDTQGDALDAQGDGMDMRGGGMGGMH